MGNGCSLEDLHCAVYKVLTEDAELMALTTAVFNHVPQKSRVYPYTTIGRVDGGDFATFDDSGDDMIYNIDIYGKSKSMDVIYQIAFRIKQLLNRQEDVLNDAGLCCIIMFNYNGMIENPLHNMEVEGRLLTIEFNVKTL